jgi:outer membrane protein OmpA-like peptidoglycan-associated protein
MNGKSFISWFNYPAIFVWLAVFGLSASHGEAFVKYTDPDVSSYRVPSASPVYLNNNKVGEVLYVKRGEGEPTLVTPLGKDELAVYSPEQNLSAKDFELNNRKVGEVVYFKRGENEPVRVTPLRKDEIAVTSSDNNLSAEDVEFIASESPEVLEAFIAKYAPDELAFVAVQRLVEPLLDAKDWVSARAILEKFSAKFPAKSLTFSKIYGIIDAPGGEVVVNNLGSGINSLGGEYAPVISSNGKKLIFARDCGVCEGGEEVYVSTLNDSCTWGEASKFGSPLSSRSNEIPLALSSDGNTLAIFGNYTGSLGRGDIFHLDKTKEDWGTLQHYPAPLNSEYFDSYATFSSDGTAILFVSDRPGGVGEFHRKGSFFHGDFAGNTDIYAFVPDSVGGGVVMNLGSVINTPYAEYSPFLHPDGKTLYFSSNGHPGLGGLDVFKSTRLRADSWTEWSEPVNLGKEINTPYNDWGYQFDAHGDKAYFAVGNRPGGFGGSDIYTVSLPVKIQPGGVISVSGKVTDPAGNFLAADLRWNDLLAGKEVGRATSDPQNGEYIINLPTGGKYAYYAEKPGYMGQSENLDLTEELGYREFVMDIVLYPIAKPAEDLSKVIAEIRMNNVFFDFDKSSLRSESKLELDRWVKMLKENPSVSLEIDGHTDNIGTEAYNLGLSERRVKAVALYIEEQGIAVRRLTSRGFGEKKPVATNKTAKGRQENRRVEVRIIFDGRLPTH